MIPEPPPVFVVPGMRVGCFPYYAIRDASLECFFDSACLNSTAQWISTLPASAWPKPLNSSTVSIFSPTTTVSSIFEQQMVENWEPLTNFSNYYKACSPIECTYTLTKRGDLIYVVTTLIGLFGGLLVALKFVSPLMIDVYRYFEKLISTRKQPKVNLQSSKQGNKSNIP